jgi:hypothetical protein
MLRLVKQGLRDMEETEPDRVLLGFFGIVVFGRAVTNALQNLRTFDRQAFDDWYEPWQREMIDDPLLRWFYTLRSDILKGIFPMVGIVLASVGREDLYPGAITVNDRPPPDIHRKQHVKDRKMITLCGLYVTYLEEMVESATPVVVQVDDQMMAAQRDMPGLAST